MGMNEDKLGRILNNIFDLIIISVRIGVSYMVELWCSLSWIWKEDLPPHMQEEVEMWNGGSTGRKDDGILIDDITDTPYDVDESKIMDSKGIIYDGMMDSVETES